jgi:hypothetical protein
MRLANYTVQLDVPENTPEKELEQMCRSLSLLDLRSVMELVIANWTRNNRALRNVNVTVEE